LIYVCFKARGSGAVGISEDGAGAFDDGGFLSSGSGGKPKKTDE